MFAKLIVSAENRDRAIRRMDRGLGEFEVEGVPTTIPLHRWILGSRAFNKATHTTTWLEKALRDAELPGDEWIPPPPGESKAPVPAELAWLVPIVNAGLVTLVAYLPSPVSRRGRARRSTQP